MVTSPAKGNLRQPGDSRRQRVLARIRGSIMPLTNGWDGEPMNKGITAEAGEVAIALVQGLPDISRSFSVFPMSAGGIIFENMKHPNWACDIEVSPQGTVTCYVVNYGGSDPEVVKAFNLKDDVQALITEVQRFLEEAFYTQVNTLNN